MSIEFIADEPLWVEKYRPQRLSDCIMKPSTAIEMKQIVERGVIGQLLLSGPPGTGKTTIAKVLCKELDLDWRIINASSDRGIDTIRDTVEKFASSSSMSGNGKCFILDEADRLTLPAQDALKSMQEKFSKHCSFIMTANHPNRLSEAIHSRFTNIDFSIDKSAIEQMQAKLFMRLREILTNEEVPFDDRTLVALIQKHFPDNRKIIGLLQHYSTHGKIDEGILMLVDTVSIESFVEAIKAKKFKDVLNFAANNANNDTSMMYDQLYRYMIKNIDPNSVADAITIINDYQRFDHVVPSRELHLTAMGTELMTNVVFK